MGSLDDINICAGSCRLNSQLSQALYKHEFICYTSHKTTGMQKKRIIAFSKSYLQIDPELQNNIFHMLKQNAQCCLPKQSLYI